jgi:predicted ATPase
MIRRVVVLGYKSLRNITFEMQPLRILIGPNAAGKSNLVDALRLLSEAVKSDMETAVSRRGGMATVTFLGSPEKSFELVLEYFVPDPAAPRSRSDMRYRVKIADKDERPSVMEEELQIKRNRNEPGAPKLWFRAEWGRGEALRDATQGAREPFDTGDPGLLALKALGFLEAYPRIRALRTFIESWQFLTVDIRGIREPRWDERAFRLSDDATNLANVLRTLQGTAAYQAILENLKSLLDYVTEMSTDLDRGRVLLLLQEKAFRDPIEALALSDGTLRLLAILTALQTMPDHGLLCIEEPEHGLHPLLFGPLLDLIRERCPQNGSRQVLLTTHSPDMVDAAEAAEIVPVQRDPTGATELVTLDQKQLHKWLKSFRLGELWRMRQIGGVPR